MTFNGSMPGPMMVVHEGDYVELTLVNPDTNTMPHNIDFHSATGALGGGALTHDQSGRAGRAALEGHAHRRVRLSLRAGRPMIPWHVVSGMQRHRDGAAARRPEGRARASRCATTASTISARTTSTCRSDAERQVQDATSTPGESFADTTEVMRKLIPTHVVFNGRGRRADRQERDDRQGRRDRADRAFAGQPRYPART